MSLRCNIHWSPSIGHLLEKPTDFAVKQHDMSEHGDCSSLVRSFDHLL